MMTGPETIAQDQVFPLDSSSDPFVAVGVITKLYERLLPLYGSLEDFASNDLNDEFRDVFALAVGAVADPVDWERALPPSVGAEAALELLAIARHDASLAPLINACGVEQQSDGRLSALEILASGVAVSLVVFVATTSLEWREGRFIEIRKRDLDRKTMRRLADLATKIVNAISR